MTDDNANSPELPKLDNANHTDSKSSLYQYRLYALFLLWGGAGMTPLMMFSVAHDFALFKFRDLELYPRADDWNNANTEEKYGSSQKLTALQHSYESIFAVTFGMAGVICALVWVYINTIASLNYVLTSSLSIMTIACAVTIFTAVTDTDSYQVIYLILLLMITNLANFAGAGAMGSIFAFAAINKRYATNSMVFVSIGQSLAGAIYASLSLVLKVVMNDAQIKGIIYFTFGTIWILGAIITYVMAKKYRWMRTEHDLSVEQTAMLAELEEITNQQISIESAYGTDSQSKENYLNVDPDKIMSIEQFIAMSVTQTNTDSSSADNKLPDAPTQKLPQLAKRTASQTLSHLKDVINSCIFEAAFLFCSLVLTYSIYPGFSALIVSTSSNDNWKKYFKEAGVFLAHNIMNLVGRTLTFFVQFPSQRSPFWFLVLIPRTLVCYAQLTGNVSIRHASTTLIDIDAVIIGTVALNGLLHGYFIGTLLVYGALAHKDKGTVSAVVHSFGNIGVFTGAMCNYLLISFII